MTAYEAILKEAVEKAEKAYDSQPDNPLANGFAGIEKIHGNSGLVRHMKDVGKRTRDSYEHPTLPIRITKNDYKSGYDLHITSFNTQTMKKKKLGYKAALEVLQKHDIDAGAELYSRLD